MSYSVDLSTISISDYKAKLLVAHLTPSQKILLDRIDERLEALEAEGIDDLHELKQTLKTKARVAAFAAKTGLPEDWLTVLRREVNSRHPKPRKLCDFPCIPIGTVAELEEMGVKTTVQLFDLVKTLSARAELRSRLDATDDDLLLLAKLADLCRLRYVNHTFATLLVHSAYDTVERLREADGETLHANLTELNRDGAFFKGAIGLNDMRFLVAEAVEASLAVEY